MVLEALINPVSAEKRPWQAFFLGILFSSVAIILSLWIFEQFASLIMVFLTAMASIPIIYNTIKLEEQKDETDMPERFLLKEHAKALEVFMFLFLGVTCSLTVWYIVLPLLSNVLPGFFSSNAQENLFSIQTQTISAINTKVTGSSANLGYLGSILLNNLKVLVFCIIFSFLYGFGAIFILTWNASVIATAIGNVFNTKFSLAGLKYLFHGLPEILAYFTAGLAGGIISIAIIKHNMGSEKFEKVLLDSAELLFLSIFILIIAALLEAFVTPVLF